MSRKMKYDPNLYGEGKGGTYDVAQGKNGFVMSNRKIRSPFFAMRCFFCQSHFSMFSNRKKDLVEMAKSDGWSRTNARNWICPECRKKANP